MEIETAASSTTDMTFTRLTLQLDVAKLVRGQICKITASKSVRRQTAVLYIDELFLQESPDLGFSDLLNGDPLDFMDDGANSEVDII